MNNNENNNEIIKSNQNNLRNLEQFYTTGKIDDMLLEIEDKKKEIVSELITFAEKHTKPCKWDDEGNPIKYKTEVNPLVINNYFFKSVVPITCQEPQYNAEKLGLVYDYYCYIIAEVNDKIGNFPSSLTSFCKLAGITLNTLRAYKNSYDLNMRIVAEKIYDQIGDENLSMSQLGIAKERSTIFKMKSQNELVEKIQPNINISIVEKPDLDEINKKLDKYRKFVNKKEK